MYVSNSEVGANAGGASALRFDSGGRLIQAYPILMNTTLNCSGGVTPWNTWLSCEEHVQGRVWECDPLGGFGARELPSLGSFTHEAAAVDPATGHVYMTEDLPDGRFYRFVPSGLDLHGDPDLTAGKLQVAQVTGLDGRISWFDVPDPAGLTQPTRHQVEESTAFNGGEGAWYYAGGVYFSTKGDNRIWRLDLASNGLSIIYDAADFTEPVLRGVDNITVSRSGDILVAEDGDDMQIVVVSQSGMIVPIVQLVGHDGSEITGPAFDPSGTRLYFSSQRGTSGTASDGVTFEVSGVFPK